MNELVNHVQYDVVHWLFVSSCVYEVPSLLRLLVVACIASKDERNIPGKFMVSTSALVYTV